MKRSSSDAELGAFVSRHPVALLATSLVFGLLGRAALAMDEDTVYLAEGTLDVAGVGALGLGLLGVTTAIYRLTRN